MMARSRDLPIRARVETVNEKATFRDSFERRRCLIPADGFYEWERKEKGKLPHYIYAADGSHSVGRTRG